MLGTSGRVGWAWRVRVMGMVAALISIAARANRKKVRMLPSCNSCWARVSAPRLINMYTANTRPRVSPVASAFSQLSMTMYSVTSARPSNTRSSSHTQGLTSMACSRVMTQASAALNAKARIWPMRLISGAVNQEPSR